MNYLELSIDLTQLRESCTNSLLNLAPERKAALIDGAIGRKDTVKVINLVLKQLRQIASSPKRHNGSMGVEVADAYLKMPPDTYHEIWKRETIVPQLHHLAAGASDRRIDERERFADVEKDHAPSDADLRGGYSSAEVVSPAEIVERRSQVAN